MSRISLKKGSQNFFEERDSDLKKNLFFYLSILKRKGLAFLWKNLRFSLKKVSDSFWTKISNLRWRKSQIFCERKVTQFLWRNRPRFSLKIFMRIYEKIEWWNVDGCFVYITYSKLKQTGLIFWSVLIYVIYPWKRSVTSRYLNPISIWLGLTF